MFLNLRLLSLFTTLMAQSKGSWDSLESNCRFTTNSPNSNFSKRCIITQLWSTKMSKLWESNIWCKTLPITRSIKLLVLACSLLSGQLLTTFRRPWDQPGALSSLRLGWPLISKLWSHSLLCNSKQPWTRLPNLTLISMESSWILITWSDSNKYFVAKQIEAI